MSVSGTILRTTPLNVVPNTVNEQVVQTITLPTKLLSGNERGLAFFVWGSTAANSNNKEAVIRLNSITGTVLADTTAVAANAKGWLIWLWLFRTGPNTQDFISESEMGTTQNVIFGQLTQNSNTGLTTFVITLNNATVANDSTLRGWNVDLLTEGGIQSASGVLL